MEVSFREPGLGETRQQPCFGVGSGGFHGVISKRRPALLIAMENPNARVKPGAEKSDRHLASENAIEVIEERATDGCCLVWAV